MADVGFSTSALYRLRVPFGERISFYRSLGATAIELSFPFTAELLGFELSSKMAKDIKEFSYISIHAPFKEVKYDSGLGTARILEKLAALCKSLPVEGIVLHPNLVSDFSLLEESGLPFLLENMDKGKEFGTLPKHFERLKSEYRFGFVLDTQHCFENDHSMELCKQLASVMGNRLKHMHVSGFSKKENHAPVHTADNKGKIVEILELGLKVPKILEGALLGNALQTASKELAFVKGFEK